MVGSDNNQSLANGVIKLIKQTFFPSGTPSSPNPYLDYYIEDRAKVAKNYDLGHELHMVSAC